MIIVESLNKDSYGGGIVGEITSLSFSLKMVDVHGEGFFLLLLYFHKTACGHMDISYIFLIAINP